MTRQRPTASTKFRRARRTAAACTVALIVGHAATAVAQSLTASFAGDFTVNSFGSVASSGAVIAFAPNINNKVYIGTVSHGILAFNYDPVTGISNPQVAVPTADSSVNGANGALGIAFHQDPTYGLVMYYAPNATGPNETLNLSIRRANDSNGDGVFGGAGDSLNQTIVNNLKAAGEGGHRLNNIAFRGNTMFINIGSRTQNGGIDTDARYENVGQTRGGLQAGNYSSAGTNSAYGEFAYTGSVNFIEDVTQIGASTNAAGFTITNTLAAHATDTQPYTSTDPSKLRVYATGLRNVYGLGISDAGEIFASENQNEWPARYTPDRFFKIATFKDDFGYPKSNGYIDSSRVKPNFSVAAAPLAGVNGTNGSPYFSMVGTYRDPSGSATAQTAATAGYFHQNAQLDADSNGQIDLQEIKNAAFALVPNMPSSNPSVTGLSFLSSLIARQDLAGDVLVGEYNLGGISLIDKDTGTVQKFLTGFSNTIDVERDPFGNMLALNTGGSLIRIAPNALINGVYLLLTVDPATGVGQLKNNSISTIIRLQGYTVASPSGSLKPGNGDWLSLSDQSVTGVDEANATTNFLSELVPLVANTLTLAPGQSYTMGDLFKTVGEGGTQDLALQYLLLTTPNGDYNNNGTVDGADYVMWRKNLGANMTLPGEAATPGQVTVEDYAIWRGNFGATASVTGSAIRNGVVKYESSSLFSGTAVPEPASFCLWIGSLAGASVVLRRLGFSLTRGFD